MVEEDSLTLYSRVKRTPYFKNTERKSNKWITGECDVRDCRIIIDTKSSWDIFSFFRAKNAPLDAMYWWQVQGYMGLYDCDSAIVAYCLVDTPQTLIDEELKKLWYKLGCPDKFSDDWMAAEQEMIRLCKYDDIPLEDRVHEFFVERDDSKMQACYKRVEDCRKWMNENLFKVTQPILT